MAKINKKIIAGIVIITIIAILGVIIGILISMNIDNNEKIEDTDISKLKQYVNFQEYDYKTNIKEKGYVTQDDALKIVALSNVKRGNKEITVKEYIEKCISVNKINIEFVENESPYWKIDIGRVGSSYIEWANFKVDYYTGELLYNSVGIQLNVD